MRDHTGEPFVIAVDSGGTHTRVACFGLDGSLLSTVTGRGGSPFHNKDAAENVARAVRECLGIADLDARDAVGLAAGIAHRGALLGKPGIIVIAGTGSTTLAITQDGHEVENGWFEHYAGAARHLAFDAMQLILSGAHGDEDAELVSDVLSHWGAKDVHQLRATVLVLRRMERTDRMPRYGRLAPRITAAAETSPLADRALRELARKTARGVHLVAPLVGENPVPVALEGAVATHPSFRKRLDDALGAEPGAVPTVIVPSVLGPVQGAALLAYEVAGIPWTDDVLAHLAESASRR